MERLQAHFRVKEVAQRTGFSTKTVLRAIASGQLPALRAGPRLVSIPRDGVEKWILTLRQNAVSMSTNAVKDADRR